MSALPPRPAPARRLTVLGVLAAVLLVLVGTVHALVPRSPHVYGSAIEAYSGYVPQTTCSPTAKPGTVALRDLLLRTYVGSRNLGISRACSTGGASEHKEGRAFDWGVRVDRTSEKAMADQFLAWLLATDRYGNRAANARRLGVMYVIWNKRIWGSYAASSGWRTYTGANPHTDHVHISLSRPGGAGTTSFWTGRVGSTSPPPASTAPAPAPAPATTPVPAAAPGTVPAPTPPASLAQGAPLQDETLAVPPTRAGATTTTALVAGQRYRVEVRGIWRFDGRAGSAVDGECSRTAKDGTWRPARRLVSGPAGDQLGLYLDGRNLALTPYEGTSCATTSHTYRTDVTAPRTGRVALRAWEPVPAAGYANNTGRLSVRIIRLVPRPSLPVRVSTRDRAGTTTAGVVVAGSRYLVTASGTWSAGAGVQADATCSTALGRGWHHNSSESLRHHLDLHLDGEALSRKCRDDHTYAWEMTAERTAPVVLRVQDTSYGDNAGTLSVVLTRLPDREDDGDGDGDGDHGRR